jgi:hypothetical protein
MTLYTHKITLKHDKSTSKLITTGTNPKANIDSILVAENCPMSAIIKIELIKKEEIKH